MLTNWVFFGLNTILGLTISLDTDAMRASINLAFGFQKQFHRFIIEPYLYFGFMNRNVKNPDREFNEDLGHIENNGNHDFFGFSSKEESSGNYGNFSFGFRVGYRF